jgi:putative PEP-CTERM system histidine kinase
LSKHFFKNKYDYREEWLKFTRTLSSASHGDMRESVIRAISAIMESPGAVMWLRRGRGGEELEPVARWVTAFPLNAIETACSPLVTFLAEKGWTVFLDEFEENPEHYAGLSLPVWLRHFHEPWIIVPLLHRDDLIGFLVLSRSKTKTGLNWEDSDLLKTVGKQAASYLALAEAHEALSEASQFEAFNRLSSFVVHDLKNLTAQLSLVVSNAKRHLDNPAFVEDAIRTVENATSKMNRLLAQLKKGRLEETQSKLINLRVLLEKVVAACALNEPAPTLECHGAGLVVRGDPDRLGAVFENLVRNAQEATPRDGRVAVRLSRRENDVVVDVVDTGCGMSTDFIRDRLFKPFDTTKGNAGMGIGVFEARAIVTGRGGTFRVRSAPGQGTTFTLSLPSEADEVNVEPLREASV